MSTFTSTISFFFIIVCFSFNSIYLFWSTICCCSYKVQPAPSQVHTYDHSSSPFPLIYTTRFLALSLSFPTFSYLQSLSKTLMASKFISFLCVIFLLLLCNRPAAFAARPAPALSSEAETTQIPNQVG